MQLTIEQKYAALSDLREYDEVLPDHRFTLVRGETINDFADDAREFAETQDVSLNNVTVCDTCGVLMLVNPFDDECAGCAARRKVAA